MALSRISRGRECSKPATYRKNKQSRLSFCWPYLICMRFSSMFSNFSFIVIFLLHCFFFGFFFFLLLLQRLSSRRLRLVDKRTRERADLPQNGVGKKKDNRTKRKRNRKTKQKGQSQ